jgi:hypothetical protein
VITFGVVSVVNPTRALLNWNFLSVPFATKFSVVRSYMYVLPALVYEVSVVAVLPGAPIATILPSLFVLTLVPKPLTSGSSVTIRFTSVNELSYMRLIIELFAGAMSNVIYSCDGVLI